MLDQRVVVLATIVLWSSFMARMVKCIIVEQMEKYFFGSGADVAAGYVPPSQK